MLFGWFAVLVSLSSPRALEPRAPLPKEPLVEPSGPATLQVKFVDDALVRSSPRGLATSGSATARRELRRINEQLRAHEARLAPLFTDAAGTAHLLQRAAVQSGRAQPDLLGTHHVVVAAARRFELARALQADATVEFVSLRPIAPPSPADIEPPTPDLTEFQGYATAEVGVNATTAWAMGYDGSGVRLSDVEYSWITTHEEWNEGQMLPEPNQTPDLDSLKGIDDGNHGTAVAGELIAGDNGYGVTGLSPGSMLGVYPTLTVEAGSRRPEAIINAANDSLSGDIVLLEMQISDVSTGLLGPAELENVVWMATRVATDAGVVVVGAAGNGALNLDREELAYYRERGDSGAILVGAGRPNTREALNFSSYGARVDVQGWGSDVFTTGYGAHEIFGEDLNQSYTDTFAGTSSASPIVAGAAALVQQAVRENAGTSLTSQQMRAVLIGTGLPQPGDGTTHIGPLPQVPEAIAAALLPQDAEPQVQIATPGATQTEASTFVTSIAVEASEDTARVQLAINGELQPVVDDVPPFAFEEVVFPEGTWTLTATATNIWDVEGVSEEVVIEVGYVPPPPASTGDAGDSSGVGEAGTGGPQTSGEDTTSTSGAETTAAPSTGGLPSASGGSTDGGCGCGVSTPAHGLWLLGFAFLRRRRREEQSKREQG